MDAQQSRQCLVRGWIAAVELRPGDEPMRSE